MKPKISLGQKPLEQTVAIQPKFEGGNVARIRRTGPNAGFFRFCPTSPAFEKDLGKIPMKKDVQELSNVTCFGQQHQNANGY